MGKQEHIYLKPADCLDAIITCIKAREPFIVWGDPGIAKTAIIRQASARLFGTDEDLQREIHGSASLKDHPYLRTLILSQREPSDVLGLPVPDMKTQQVVWFKPDVFPKEGRGLFYMDEYAQATNILQGPSRQMLTERRFGPHELPDGWAVGAASNYPSNRAGANKLLTHVSSSIVHLHMIPDVDDFCAIAARRNMHPIISAFIRFRRELLMQFNADGDTFPCPRTWEKLSHLIEAEPTPATEHALYAGAIGEAAAAEFLGYMRIWKNLPDIEKILRDPDGSKVPHKADVATLYALSAALGRVATVENFPAVVRYVQRMPTEFNVYAIRDAVRRNEQLMDGGGKNTKEAVACAKAFVEWGTKYSDVVR